jgi:hypothetical protein
VLTQEDFEKLREARRNEVGTKPPCPLCGRRRVERSDYIRCIPCAMNWLEGEDLGKDARLSRDPYLIWKSSKVGAKKEPARTE